MSMTSFEGLYTIKALVVHPRDQDGETIARHVRRLGCQVEVTWPPPFDIPGWAEIVYYLINEETVRCLPWHGRRPHAAIVGVLDRDKLSAVSLLEEANVHAVVVKPADPFDILTSIAIARNVCRFEGRLATKVRKLEETLRSIRIVEKAKSILMKEKNMKEKEAYEFLRQKAMDSSTPIGKVANSIIEAREIYK
jgi:AmiR/NasT family two-component response regulator